jgi:hypothetical protein
MRLAKAVLVVAVALPGVARAQQQGFAQALDPTAPLGDGRVPQGQPLPDPLPAKDHFGRQQQPDCSGAFFRKVKSAKRASYRGITATVTLPEVRNFDPADKVAPSIYLGGHAGDELDIGLSYDVARDKNGNPLRDANGNDVYAFRPFARYPGMSWWTNSPNQTGKNKGDWESNSRQYFYPGEQVTMTVRVTGHEEIELTIASTTDSTKSLHRVFDGVRGFAPGRATEWKRVHSIDESGQENKSVRPTSASLVGGHWDVVELLLADGSREPVIGSGFVDVPGGDFHESNGTIDAVKYNAVFKPASGWGWTTTGGEAIDVEPPSFFAR